MTWVRLDDNFAEHERILGLSDRAFRLHVAALCYCARNLTDGAIDRPRLKIVSAVVSATRRQVTELQDAGLWEPNGDGWLIRDYLEYNPDAATVKALREQRKLAGQRGGQASGQARRPATAAANGQANPEANALALAGPLGSSKGGSTPSPTPTPKEQHPVTATQDAARDPDDGNGYGDEHLKHLEQIATSEDIPW